VLGLPLDVQALEASTDVRPPEVAASTAPDVDALVAAIDAARRPVFIAGRGAARCAEPLIALADRCGALLAVSAAAKGLFTGDPWNLDVSGGFATPLAASLIAGADLVVAWGSTLNMWTTRHGKLIGSAATVAQVDRDPAALGVNRPIDLGVAGDVASVAALAAERVSPSAGYRTAEVRERIAKEGRWRDVPYADDSTAGRIDPRTLSIALDDALPAQRTVVVDSGNFMGYPSMFLSVPDAAGFCFTQAFQSIGLGLASALGAAVARPDRLTVAALGDGGFLMSAAELLTAVRLALPLLVVVYNDAAYGAEVHHFGPTGTCSTRFVPRPGLAAIGRGYGCDGVTVRSPADLARGASWLAGRASARWWSTRKGVASTARGGSRRPSAAILNRSGPEFLGQSDDDALGSADVAQPVDVLVPHDLADEFGTAGEQAGNDVSMSSTANMTRRMPSVFVGVVGRFGADRLRRMEHRQLDPSVAVRGPQHRDVLSHVVDPDDALHPAPLDRRLAFQLHAEFDEETR
jgi:hypothetical protein